MLYKIIQDKLHYKYPVLILKRLVLKKQLLIDTGKFLGLVLGSADVISLVNVTHKINSVLILLNGDITLDIDFLPTQMYLKIKGLQLLFAPRGFGTVDLNGVIQDDYNLITFDIIIHR